MIETGLDGFEVQRTEAPRPRWLSEVLARIYTQAQVNEASPDLFRPAINTLYCIVTFYTQRTTSDKRQTRAFSVKVSTEDKICQRLEVDPDLGVLCF